MGNNKIKGYNLFTKGIFNMKNFLLGVKLSSFAFLLLAVFFFTGCYTLPPEPQPELPPIEPVFPTPQESLNLALQALKSAEADALQQYIYFDEESEISAEDMVNNDFLEQYNIDVGTVSKSMSAIMSQLYTHLDYEILSSNVVGDEALLTLSLTTPDGEAIIERFIEEFAVLYAKNIFSGENTVQDTVEDVAAMLLSDIEMLAEDTVTSNVTVRMIKGEEHWLVRPDRDLADAITGGTITASQKLVNLAEKFV